MPDTMPDEELVFGDFVCRIREGDQRAAEELVRRYQPLIQRQVRLHLEDRRLARTLDSVDICQSVFGSFFIRVVGGQYNLDSPQQLAALLVKMARNKLASAARYHHRQRRDSRRVTSNPKAVAALADHHESPSQVVSLNELLQKFNAATSDEERQLASLRAEGLSWKEVAERMGGTAQARRMQLARAIDRVASQLDL